MDPKQRKDYTANISALKSQYRAFSKTDAGRDFMEMMTGERSNTLDEATAEQDNATKALALLHDANGIGIVKSYFENMLGD